MAFLNTTSNMLAALAAAAKYNGPLELYILNLVYEWINSEKRAAMLTGERYYRNRNDILNRRRTMIGEGGKPVAVDNLPNNRVAHPFARTLNDQKTSYLFAKPFTIATGNDAYKQTLTEIFDDILHGAINNLGREAINKGIAWLHPYYDETGALKFRVIPSEEIIPLWSDSAHTKFDAVIRTYNVENFINQRKIEVTKVEWWDGDGVRRYMVGDGSLPSAMAASGRTLTPDFEAGYISSHFTAVVESQEVPMNWARLPFIPFKYNPDEQPLIRNVKNSIDSYDTAVSDFVNQMQEDSGSSILVVKNYGGQDMGEFRRNLSTFRAVNVLDNGGLEALTTQVAAANFTALELMLRKNIFKHGRGVDTEGDRIGSNPSGVSLKFIYSDLDLDCNMLETQFQIGLDSLMWFINTDLANRGAGDFGGEEVEFTFTRDIIINESEKITSAQTSLGIISEETVVANHPWVTNPLEELKRMKREREEKMSEAMNGTVPYPDAHGGDNENDGEDTPVTGDGNEKL
ncbi:MAG: phage portal protein [Defluviitaleaceae bacterium]|nr:phage portal protein [Defluviitaleaceae bacterium]